MAKIAANLIRVYMDEFDLSGDLNATDLGVTQETPVVTSFADAGPRRLTANYDHKSSLNGFFDGADNAFDERAFVDLNTDEDHFLAQVYGTAEGSVAYESIVGLDGQPRSGGEGGAVLLNLSAVGRNRLTRAALLRSAALTAAGNGTGQNLGATTSGQLLVVVFRLLSFTGTSVTLTVEESTDNGGGDAYAAIAGLTSGALSAAGVVRMTTTAATEAWKRVVAAGTFSAAAVRVTVGVAS